jgi:hypothetical protein
LPLQDLEERSYAAISRRVVSGILTLAILSFVIAGVFALLPLLRPDFLDLVCPYASGCTP